MIAFPEILHRGGEEIWTTEIVHQLESHHSRTTYGNETVARKITIELETENTRGNQYAHAIVIDHIVIDGINIDGASVCYDQLEKVTPQHQMDTADHLFGIEAMLFIKLAQEIGAALNGTRH